MRLYTVLRRSLVLECGGLSINDDIIHALNFPYLNSDQMCYTIVSELCTSGHYKLLNFCMNPIDPVYWYYLDTLNNHFR